MRYLLDASKGFCISRIFVNPRLPRQSFLERDLGALQSDEPIGRCQVQGVIFDFV